MADSQIRKMLRDYRSTQDPILLQRISQVLGREGIVVTQPLATKKLQHPNLDKVISCSLSDDDLLFVTVSSGQTSSPACSVLFWDALTGDLLSEYNSPDSITEAIFLNSQTLLCLGPTSIFIYNLTNNSTHYLENSSSFSGLRSGIYHPCFCKETNQLFYQRQIANNLNQTPEDTVLGIVVNVETGESIQLKTTIVHYQRQSRGPLASFLKGNVIAIGNGTYLEFFDTTNGNLLRQIEHTSRISSLVVSPDETRCVIFMERSFFYANNLVTYYQYSLYDLYSDTSYYTAAESQEEIVTCEFSPDSQQILMGVSLPVVGRAQWGYANIDHTIPILFLLDSATGNHLRTLITSPSRSQQGPSKPMVRSISLAKFINGGESILAGDMVSRDLTPSLLIFDTQSGQELSKFGELEGEIICCSISEDSTRLLVGSTKKLRDAEGVGWMAGRYASGPIVNILEMWYLGP
jgi:hypothetical protein